MTIYLLLALLALLILFRKQIAESFSLLRSDPKAFIWLLWKEWGEPLLVALVLAVAIRTFIIGPYKIPTGSMIDTLLVGDRIFVDKLSYRFHGPKRGDVIVFKYPLDPKKDFVKRLVGLGGEELEIKDGNVYINGSLVQEPAAIRNRYYYNFNSWRYGREGQKIEIPKGYYFVLGDNSAHSSDSRFWGFVAKKYLIGHAVVIWWPLNRIGLLH